MKNLKKVLSLALALVMAMSLMTTAFAEDFSDADAISNVEAVEVMSAIGVLEGSNGAFNPEGTLTREQGAKIIAYMLLGPDAAEALTVSGAPFADVAADRWSAPYIAYCAEEGILNGVGNNNYNPTGTLTALQFAKMCLCALGYRGDIEGFTGDNWGTNVAKIAIPAGLNANNIALANVAVSREDAAQIAFNTLTATLVGYTGGTSVETSDGTKITVGAIRDEIQAAGEDYTVAATTDGKEATVQFCERYFSELMKDAGAADDFTRAADHGWYLEKGNNTTCNGTDVRVHNAMKTAAFTYTAKMKDTDLAKDLKGYTFGGTKLVDKNTVYDGNGDATWNESITIGDLTLNEDSTGVPAGDATVIATALAALTENGTVVEIYIDANGAVEDVNVITSTVETIDSITTASNGDVTYALSVTGNKVDVADVDGTDTVKLHGTFAKGDVVTTVAGTSYVHVYPTTSFEAAQSAKNTNTNVITLNGVAYTVGTGVSDGTDNVSIANDFNTNSTTEAVYYLDQYGFVVATTAISTTYTNYAQVKGETSKLDVTVDGSTPVVEGRFLLADGTVATYNVKVDYDKTTGTYSIAGTDIYDIDVDAGGASDTLNSSLDTEGEMQGAVTGLLTPDAVFAYSLKDNTIDLQAVATVATADTVVVGAPGAAVATGATSATVATKTTLLDKDTVYVLYNATDKVATTYVGKLPAGASLATGTTKVVALCDSSNALASAKVVFAVSADVSAVATDDYAYINNTEYTTELIDDVNYRVYEAVKADGSIVKVYDDNAGTIVDAAGLYTWDDDMNVTGDYTTGVQGAATYTVVGEQMVNGTTVYNMAGAKVIYIDTTKTAVDGNSSIVVLEMDGSTPTKNAAVIYVVG